MRLRTAAIGAGLLVVMSPGPALAQADCSRVVVLTLPTVTWDQLADLRPPNLLEASRRGAIGSVSVRTNSSRTTYASGFATIGAGTRLDVPSGAGMAPVPDQSGFGPVSVTGLDRIEELADAQGYSSARAGALSEGLIAGGVDPALAIGNHSPGLDPASPAGQGSYVLLAAMDHEGDVARAAVGADLLEADSAAPFGVRTDDAALRAAVDVALQDECAVVVVDHGDLIRFDRAAVSGLEPSPAALQDAIAAADSLLGHVMERLRFERDLLLVASPASALRVDEVHFGPALAIGPGFEAGRELSSPSTRRKGMVTLPDIAPTVLSHLDLERPASMLGRAWFAEPVAETDRDRIAAAVDLDRESVFIDSMRTPLSTAFVLFQLLVYAVAIWVLARPERRGGAGRLRRTLQLAALALATFPLSTYIAGVIQGHAVGEMGYVALLVGITVTGVAAVTMVTADPLRRLLLVVGATFAVLVVDLVVGAPLQLNTVFSYSPIVAGRFAGIGNIGFAILAATSLLTGALIVHSARGSRAALAAAAGLFALTVVVDGAPRFGSDVGGAIALVPGLAISWLLLAGRRPSVRSVAIALLAGAAVLGAFLALDLARPEESRTHLARLYEDVRDGGSTVLTDAITRKVRTNLRVLGSTIWTFVVPPALGLLAWLLLRPRWQWLSRTYPKVRAGLVGGLVMAVLGYAVNDSGIVIPAMMFSYLVPVAVLAYLSPRGQLGVRP